MSIITATEVRFTGDWDSAQYSDGMLHSAAFIPTADSWLNYVCSTNGYTSYSAITNATIQAACKGAECYYAAALVTSIPPKDDFQTGPVKSTSVKGADKKTMADNFMKIAKELLGRIGFKFNVWTFTSAGGKDYHPSGYDETNIDVRYTDSKHAFDFQGGQQ